MEALSAIYRDVYSASEIETVASFAETPGGVAEIEKGPAVRSSPYPKAGHV
jgi:hypothetical protein